MLQDRLFAFKNQNKENAKKAILGKKEIFANFALEKWKFLVNLPWKNGKRHD